MALTLMVQGCTSDAGKSVMVAGICRLLRQRGYKVAPFKPQNMALNSAVTADGGEIGRAQAVQARACGLPPHTDFNPVLLKPSSDTGAQIIIHGKALSNMEAADYHGYKKRAMSAVLESHRRLCQQYDIIVVEGAGSPAEINLRDNDIANMGFAEAVDCPVILVADIDRGGVFAHLVGTLALLSPSEQQRVVGFVINRFRGDIRLLQSGLDWLESRTGKPVLGVIPYLQEFYLEAEDAIDRSHQTAPLLNPASRNDTLHIVVPVLSRISNHTDMDVLRLHPQVQLTFVGPGQSLPAADLIILPGTKNTRLDLAFLYQQQWDKDIARHLRYGGKLLGICGGFQMLGQQVHDPEGIEGTAGSSPGLGYLEFETTLAKEKILRQVQGQLLETGAAVSGYEIHAGRSYGPALATPLIDLYGTFDGARSSDNHILGSYLHGLFDHIEAREALLRWAGLDEVTQLDYEQILEANLDRLADCLDDKLTLSSLIP